MNDLGNDARALIELARDAHDPGDDDRARVRTRLASQLGVAAGLGVVAGLGVAAKTTATVGAAAGAGAGAGMTAGTLGAGAAALKLIGAVLVVSATVGAGAVVVQHARRASVARVAVAEKAPPPSPRRTTPVAATVGVAAAPETAPAEASGPATNPIQQSPNIHSATHSSSPPPVVASATEKAAQAPAVGPVPKNRLADAEAARRALAPRTSAPAVADEASLFHDGIVALRSGQPARALELFELHARLYPHGVLAEERDAERALALADVGRTAEAREAIDRFLKAHPTSPLAARLVARAHLLDATDVKPGSRDDSTRAGTQRQAP